MHDAVPERVSYKSLLDELYSRGAHKNPAELSYYVQLIRDLHRLDEQAAQQQQAAQAQVTRIRPAVTRKKMAS